MTAEWLAQHFPDGGYWTNFPLGAVPPELQGTGASYSLRRRVDGLAVTKTELTLIEAKVWKPMDGVDKLPVYKQLVPLTPELMFYHNLPIKMILVCPRATSTVMESAKISGIEVQTYSAPWLTEVLNYIDYLYTTAGRTAMAERAQQRKWLGL